MNVETYRLNAEKCLELAQTFNDQERKRVKRVMLDMANAWLLFDGGKAKVSPDTVGIPKP